MMGFFLIERAVPSETLLDIVLSCYRWSCKLLCSLLYSATI